MTTSRTIGYYLAENTSGFNDPVVKHHTKNYLRIETVLQDGGVVNRNKRLYPTEVIEEASRAPFVRDRLASKTWFGEANHPFTKDFKRMQTVDVSRLSHIIVSFAKEGDNLFVGEVETASRSPLGDTMRGVIEQGGKIGFSMRGFAHIKEEERGGEKIGIVSSPLVLVTYDWVMDPSHRKATMRGVKEDGSSAEDSMVPVMEKELREFLTENSERYGMISDLLVDDETDGVSLSPDGKWLRNKGPDGTSVVRLEDRVRELYLQKMCG